MPYIDKTSRKNLQKLINAIDKEFSRKDSAMTPGNLNYLITLMCHAYLKKNGLKYLFCNDIVGALECAKQEFYRRKVAPYEDECIERNGDI